MNGNVSTCLISCMFFGVCFFLFRYELRFLRVQDGSTAQKLLPHSCCQLGSKNCCLLALIARCLLYSLVTSCLWNSIIILCILQRKKKKQTQREGERNASPTPLLFHQDLFYFCSVPFISFHWPAVCLYSHIKVTFATPFPPKSPPPLFLVWRPKKKRDTHKEGGLLHIFSRLQDNTWHVGWFFF